MRKIYNNCYLYNLGRSEVPPIKNITKAANTLYLTQSALSHQLRELQDIYKTKIFDRVNKEMVPTRVGEKLVEVANRVLAEIENGDSEINNIVSNNKGTIRLSTQCYTFYHWLSPILTEFINSFPKVEVKIVSEATYDTLNYLEDGKLDLAILNFKPKDNNLSLVELFEDDLYLIVSTQHKFANRKIINPEDIVDENYITYSLPQGYGVTFDQVFKRSNLFPRKITKVPLTEAIVEMVKSNFGVAVMASWALEPYLRSSELIKIKITRRGIRRKWYAATMGYKQKPKYLEHFIDTIKQVRN